MKRSPLMTNKRSIKAACPYAAAFLLSFFAGVVLFAVQNIAPFGDQSVLCMDLWGQYFPMYISNAQADLPGEMLYSWQGALGYNNVAQTAYYANSLFVWPLRFIPLSQTVNAINWFCVLKLSLASVTCLAFLKHHLKTVSPVMVSGSVAYSLCAYMLAFLSQFMWTDCLFWAPLVLLGLEKLINERKPIMYALTLAAAMLSSFYIGFAMCIFMMLYYLFAASQLLEFRRKDRFRFSVTGWKKVGSSAWRFALFSLLAGGMATVVLLPVIKAISQTLASDMAAPDKVEWYTSAITYLQSLLPEQPLELTYLRANLAVGFLIFLTVPLFFFNKQIRLSERIMAALLTAFMMMSTNNNILDYIWHGFHFPNQLPGRWTFLLSLFLILMGVTALVKSEGLTLPRTILGVSLGFSLSIYSCIKTDTHISFYFWLILAAAAVALIARAWIAAYLNNQAKEHSPNKPSQSKAPYSKANDQRITMQNTANDEVMVPATWSVSKKSTGKNRISRNQHRILKKAGVVCLTAVAVLQCMDSITNFVSVSTLEPGGMLTADGVNYVSQMERINTYGSKWQNGKNDFYRVEANPGFTFDPGLIGNYPGIGYYASTMQGNIYNLFRSFGNRVYAQNVSSVYNIHSPVQNSLFGIKYILDFQGSLADTDIGLAWLAKEEEAKICENLTALPVAFAAADTLSSWTISNQLRGIQNQDDFLDAICGQDAGVFQKMTSDLFSYDNATVSDTGDWESTYYHRMNASSPVVFHYTYQCEQDGPVYLEHNYRAGSIHVTAGSDSFDMETASEPMRYIGNRSQGETVSIDVTVEDVNIGLCGLNLYRMDTDAWTSAYEHLASQGINVDTFSHTSLGGNIQMKQGGLVFTSIPQDGGWSVTCDGNPAQTELIGETFLGVRVPEGTHRLEFHYRVPGMLTGTCISVVCLLLTILLCCPNLRQKLFFFIPSRKQMKKGEQETLPSAAVSDIPLPPASPDLPSQNAK